MGKNRISQRHLWNVIVCDGTKCFCFFSLLPGLSKFSSPVWEKSLWPKSEKISKNQKHEIDYYRYD